MKAHIDPSDSFPTGDPTAIHVTIIYEDLASGKLARGFAQRLADFLECTCPLANSVWRSELLACPPLADEAARGAADCDYLIISLRGDHVLPFATRQWIEARLDGAAERGMGFIFLSDSNQGKWRVVEATRHYFRGVCSTKDVTFFSHVVSVPAGTVASNGMQGRSLMDSNSRSKTGYRHPSTHKSKLLRQ